MDETNITIDLNNPQVFENIFKKSLEIISQISEFVKDKLAYLGINFSGMLSTILTIFIAVLLIYLATKIGNKIAKFILIILGLILIIGMVYSVISNLI